MIVLVFLYFLIKLVDEAKRLQYMVLSLIFSPSFVEGHASCFAWLLCRYNIDCVWYKGLCRFNIELACLVDVYHILLSYRLESPAAHLLSCNSGHSDSCPLLYENNFETQSKTFQ